VIDLNGKTWQTTDLKGKVTFLNVWATWCAPCLMELPRLQKLVDQYQGSHDVQFLTLNADDSPEASSLSSKSTSSTSLFFPLTNTYGRR